MASMVNDLLELSKIQAGTLRLSAEALDLYDLVSDAIADLALLAAQRGIRLGGGGDRLRAGTALGPGQLGLLAALGLTAVEVRTPVRVLLVTTGDEVVEPGTSLPQGKIYDSNGTILEAAMVQAGLRVTRTGISGDDPATLLALVRSHLGGACGRR